MDEERSFKSTTQYYYDSFMILFYTELLYRVSYDNNTRSGQFSEKSINLFRTDVNRFQLPKLGPAAMD